MRRTGGNAKRYWTAITMIIGVLIIVLAIVTRVTVFAVHQNTNTNWTTFLGSNARTSYNGTETIINPTTAPNLHLHWTAQANGHMTDEVLAANGKLYWGSWDGVMHATDPTTGQDVWATNVGTKPGSCGQTFGVVGTATVASVAINGTTTSVVFVGAGQDNLYALDAGTGQIIWQTNLGNDPAEFIYSSTSVYNGSVYIGISSFGDCPKVQGQVVQVNASTGQIQNTFNVVPAGCIGGAVWGSITIDEATGKLYFGTGNIGKCAQPMPFGKLKNSIVELNAADLSFVASWPLPKADATKPDFDYGSTPTLFQATINGVSHAMLGMANKNGYYYALDRTNISAGALWKTRISNGGADPYNAASISASAYDGTNLYVGGSALTIGSQICLGTLQSLDPNTGAFHWQLCLNGPILDPVLAVPGLVVAGWGNIMGVVDSVTGQILYSYQDTTTKGRFEAAATISNGILYDGSRSGKLFAFGL
jgi:polyvinyl alcohol dehydrogenase (cytochrome)